MERPPVPVGVRRPVQASGLDDLKRLEDPQTLDGQDVHGARSAEGIGLQDDGDG